MMAIARIYFFEKKSQEEQLQCDYKIWNYIIDNHRDWMKKDVKLLYLTQRCDSGDTSLIVDIKDSHSFADFVIKYISPLEDLKGIWLVNLIRPKFFPIPQDTPKDCQRYTATIRVESREYLNVYDLISKITPKEGAMITYIAFTFQAVGQDILLSILAKDDSVKDKFINHHIKTITGIQDVQSTEVTKTKRLIPLNEWRDYIKSYTDYDFNSENNTTIDPKDIVPWDFSDSIICC